MVTTWPPKLPYLPDAAELLAKKVELMSGHGSIWPDASCFFFPGLL